jgi:nitrile hydratase beta subunit
VEPAHDLGGRDGFGPVVVEPDEPVFHEPWERTARALVYAAIMTTDNPNTSAFRWSIERMDPDHYLASSYYEHWLTSAATMAVESGAVTLEELEERAGGRFPLSRPAEVAATAGDTDGQRFAIGDQVRVRTTPAPGHTRCPSYVRGRAGTVVDVQGTFSLPDVEAHSTERVEEALYTVRFDSSELFEDAERGTTVSVGLWDSYLEAP